MKVVLVTIAVGEKYLNEYNFLFRKSHEHYAKRHGYDFRIITEPYDKTSKFTFETLRILSTKMFICSYEWAQEYDYIIFVDADVFINPEAPALHSAYDFGDKIGIVDEYSQPTREMRIQHQIKSAKEVKSVPYSGLENGEWDTCAMDYYRIHIEKHLNTDSVFNTGVIVFQPRKHREFMEQTFEKHKANILAHKNGFHYEQVVVGYELQINNMFKIIDNKWNAVWQMYKSTCGYELDTFVKNNCFVHLAGHVDYHVIPYLNAKFYY